MNELTPAQRERILERLREGRSLRAIEAETGHRRETVGRYGRKAGLLPPVKRIAASTRSTTSAGLRHGRPMAGVRYGWRGGRSRHSSRRIHILA
jgi:hypothetical protein